jgi:hypothetical protein
MQAMRDTLLTIGFESAEQPLGLRIKESPDMCSTLQEEFFSGNTLKRLSAKLFKLGSAGNPFLLRCASLGGTPKKEGTISK